MRTVLLGVCLALFLVGDTPSAHADIFACHNADGSIDYTNVRRPGRRCTRVVEGRGERSTRRRAAAAARQSPERRAAARRSAADPHRFQRYDGFINEAATLYQLPADFVRAVVKTESNFNPNVVSVDGAVGLMQLMPRTAAGMGVRDPYDPRQNIFGGTRFLRVLANRFGGDLVLTIAAYNAGPGAVERYRGVPPYAETQRYVRRVLGHYYRLRSGGRIDGPR